MRNLENKGTGDNTHRHYTHHQAADVAYAAAVNLPIAEVNEQDVYIGQLTGNITVNLTNTDKAKLVKGDRVNVCFASDANVRTITWGTNIKAPAATLATIANGKNLVRMMFDGTDLVVNQ